MKPEHDFHRCCQKAQRTNIPQIAACRSECHLHVDTFGILFVSDGHKILC